MTRPERNNPEEERRSAIRSLLSKCIELTESGDTVAAERLLAENPELAGEVQERLQKLGSQGLLEVEGRLPEIEGYRILEHVGHGGMGDIYLAEHRSDLRMRLAVKVIKQGMDSREILARFDAEKQALARMDHGNIARIHDVGVTETGQPYFAMDYIPGIPITKFCEDMGLSVPGRLRLMLEVCSAVQHAHYKGVIHRDLKPSNILVHESEGQLVVKVIDFGVAKAIHGSLTQATVHTAHGMILGTPEYMSPEQAGRDALDVDTRTDVYSLGVILYELLVGDLPIRINRSGHLDFKAVILQTPVERPSTRVSRLGDRGSTHSRKSSLDSKSLRRSLRGQLDWVVLKALAKERHKRYETPAELAAELRRYLSGEPVDAGPPGRIYRARLLIRRHRVVVGAAALALLTLGIGLVVALQQAGIASRERDAARQASKLATASVRSLEQTVQFQRRMLDRIDPRIAGGTFMRGLRDSLSRRTNPEGDSNATLALFDKLAPDVNATDAARRLFDGQILTPALTEALGCEDVVVRGDLLETIAMVYHRIGYQEKSHEVYVELIRARREALGARNPKTLLARVYAARIRGSLGDWTTTLSELEKILAEFESIEGLDQAETISTREALALALERANRQPEAEAQFQKIIELSLKKYGRDALRTYTAQMDLATHLRVRGKYHEAETLLQRALPAMRRLFGVTSTTLYGILEMSNLLYSSGRAAEAEPYAEEALRISSELFGEDHPRTIGAAGSAVNIRRVLGKFKAAEALGEDVLKRRIRIQGARHPEVLEARIDLAGIMVDTGDMRAAEDHLRLALSGYKVVAGIRHPGTVRAMGHLGVALMHGGKLEEGVELLREAWVIGEEVFDAGHPTHLTDGANLAHALMKQGSLKEALTQIELVEKMAREGFSVDHPILAQTLGHRAQILHKKGDHKAAEVCYRQVIQGLERAAGPRSHNVVAYMALLAGMYREVGRLDEAEAMLPDLRARVEGNGSLASEIEKLAADIAGSRAGKKK